MKEVAYGGVFMWAELVGAYGDIVWAGQWWTRLFSCRRVFVCRGFLPKGSLLGGPCGSVVGVSCVSAVGVVPSGLAREGGAAHSQHEVLLPAGLAAAYSYGSALHVLHLQRHVCVELLCSGRVGQWPAVPSWVRMLTSTRRVDAQTRVPEPSFITHS